jgi:hypothetical protein
MQRPQKSKAPERTSWREIYSSLHHGSGRSSRKKQASTLARSKRPQGNKPGDTPTLTATPDTRNSCTHVVAHSHSRTAVGRDPRPDLGLLRSAATGRPSCPAINPPIASHQCVPVVAETTHDATCRRRSSTSWLSRRDRANLWRA